jgi:hypothetical protein
VLGEGLHRELDGLGEQQVVCVQEHEILALARSHAGVARGCDPAVRGLPHEADAGIARDNGARIVGRGVVHHHDLDTWVGLRQGALNGVRQ